MKAAAASPPTPQLFDATEFARHAAALTVSKTAGRGDRGITEPRRYFHREWQVLRGVTTHALCARRRRHRPVATVRSGLTLVELYTYAGADHNISQGFQSGDGSVRGVLRSNLKL